GAAHRRQHRDLLRQHPGAQGHLARGRGGRVRDADRLQRGRQVDHAALHLGPHPGAHGRDPLPGGGHLPAPSAGDRPAGDLPVARGPQVLRAHDRAREPRARRLPAPGQQRDRVGPHPGLRSVRPPQGAPEAEGGNHVGRRAADARDRPGDDGPAEAPAARRALHGDLADPHGAHLRDHRRDQQAGDHHPARRAERELRARRLAARLRARDRQGRHVQRVGIPADRPRSPEGLPRNM
ncbi:MAG: Branched-chain amino acid transport ATP-binding protein LivF, partial [uncultured Solirubrobacteraceae bacterium]